MDGYVPARVSPAHFGVFQEHGAANGRTWLSRSFVETAPQAPLNSKVMDRAGKIGEKVSHRPGGEDSYDQDVMTTPTGRRPIPIS